MVMSTHAMVKIYGGDHSDYFYREMADDTNGICVFPLTVHPDVSGRLPVRLMRERYVDRQLQV